MFKEAEGNCIIKYENGTELSKDDWEKGITLTKTYDTQKAPKKLLKLLHENNIVLIDSIVNQSNISYAGAEIEKNFLLIKTFEKFSIYEDKEVIIILIEIERIFF